MVVHITVKLDDRVAAQVKAEAADAGMSLSDWIRAALRQQVLAAKAKRARAEEDDRVPVCTAGQDDRVPVHTTGQMAALMVARRRRALATFDEW